jgi:pyruvate,water dikinase
MQVLEQQIKKPLGPERTRSAVTELSAGAHADADADLGLAVRDLSAGNLSRADFLKRFGHRGSHEMELAHPRWSEEPDAIDSIVRVDRHATPLREETETPQQRGKDRGRPNYRLCGQSDDQPCRAAQVYLGLRETAKHHFMRGYALIRRALVELDRRFKLNGGIFFLTLMNCRH